MQIRIITDDFTSACDGLVGFAGHPGGARLVMAGAPGARPDGERDSADAPGALGIDTDSRLCGDAEAAARVAPWAAAWRGADLLLKQFDSTLRGPLASECLAAWRASGRARLLVAPAFPAAGRSTRQGRVWVHGEPLAASAFGNDPRNPVTEDSVPALFSRLGLPLALARDADEAARHFSEGRCAVVVDADTEADLLALSRRFHGDRDLLWAGSTGIARALAQNAGMAAQPDPRDPPPATPLPVSRRPWVLVGSRHPVSRAQARRLAAALPSAHLRVTPDAAVDPAQAARQVARQVADAVHRGDCDGVVVTGGETARALATLLAAQAIVIHHEVEPGIPLCCLHFDAGGHPQALPLVSKAGGFGGEHSLLACLDSITGSERP